ncbi:MAG: 3'(2'),5'-bisphosphate nucleotidase CysQ [Acidimicrobiia bacterium]|nr:3'(2'),5'-bisphosphate nucleotidase CysQ [Acidimicrobiia bacterium]
MSRHGPRGGARRRRRRHRHHHAGAGLPGGGGGAAREARAPVPVNDSQGAERPSTESDHALAVRVATETGELLVRLRQDLLERGTSSWELESAGDSLAHELIVERLGEARPGDAVLSEEGADDRSRLGAERVWIVDPLDGTNEYGSPPRSDWAVHVALVEAGRPVAGAVALPAVGVTLGTEPAPELPAAEDGRPRVVASRWHPSAAAQVVAGGLNAHLLGLGSAGAKAMAVVMGQADVYAHSGGQYEWDNCAPVAVAAAAGLHCSRIDGSELVYNNPNVYLPDFLICRAELAERCLELLAEALRRGHSYQRRSWYDDDW